MTSPIETNNVVERDTPDWPERYYMSLDGDPFAAGFLKIGTAPSEGATEYMRADLAQSLSDRIDVLEDWLCEAQIRAHEWMVAHDKLKAGKPYDFPKPAPLPERGVLIRLVEESLYHLRLDDGAKAYHERALASLTQGGKNV